MKRASWLFISCFGSTVLFGGNLLPDASFELGAPDYGKLRFFDDVRLENCMNVPPVEDEKEAVHGKRSLRFDAAGNAAATSFRTPEFRLNPEKRYTLSFYAKSNGAATVKLMLLSIEKYPDGRTRRSWDNRTVKRLVLTDQWTRYSCTFQPKALHHQYYLADFAWLNKPGVSVWFDAMQLEEGSEMTDFSPKSEVEFAFQGLKRLRIGSDSPSLECRLLGVNYSKKDLDAQIRLSEQEYYFRKNLPGQTFRMTVPAEGRAEKKIRTQGHAFGVYELRGCAETSGKKSELLPFFYAVSGKYIPGAFNAGRDFALGAEESVSCNYPDLNGGKPYLQLMEGESFADYLAVKRNEGQRLLRMGNGRRFFAWGDLEKRPGEFDFSESDKFVDAMRGNGAEILGVLGPLLVREHLPAWVASRSKQIRKTLLNNRPAYLPDQKEFRQYVRAVVSHYSGKISYWEIFNEPNLSVDAATYLEYLKTAHDEIRKIDPSIRIVAPCSTGDLGGQMGKFLDDFGRLGGYAYCDIVSFHPYSSPAEDAPYPAPRAIQDIRAILKKYHCSASLWNTELYYLPTWKKAGPRDSVEVSRGRAHDLARRLLVDLGEGVKQSTLLPDAYSYRQDRHPNYDFGFSRVTDKRIPSELYVAGNAFARIFEGAVPVSKIETPLGTTLYVYRLRSGKGAAAVWNYSEKQDFRFLCKDKLKLKVFDLFGNPLEWQNPMPLSRNPLYLLSEGAPAELLQTLKRCEIRSEYASEVTFARYFSTPDGKPALALTVRNHTQNTLNARLRVLENASFRAAEKGAVRFSIPAMGTATVLVPVILKGVPEEAPAAEAEVLLQDSPSARKVKIHLDGAKFLSYVHTVTMEDSSDFRVAFRADAEPEGFRIQVSVHDPYRSGRSDTVWKDDCVELFFDPAPFENPERKEYTNSVFRLFACPVSSDGKKAVFKSEGKISPADVRWEIRDIPDGYALDLTLPWKSLNVQYRGTPPVISFDLAVDNAGKGIRRQRVWSSGKYAYLYRHRFGVIR